MKLTHEDYDQLTVLTIKGELNADDIEVVRKLAQSRLSSNTRDFVVDMRETEFVDSKGLECLLWLQEQCGEKLGQIRLASVPVHIEKVLQITRLAPRLDCHPDVDAAIKSLRM